MTLVHSEHRISPDAQAKMASMALALAQARHFVRSYEIDPASSEEFRAHAAQTRVSIDAALDGTIHSFTPNGACR